jgi:hypothetical protein
MHVRGSAPNDGELPGGSAISTCIPPADGSR